MYGVMDEVFQFVATFKDFPPRSFPPSFNPANIMETTMDAMKRREAFKENLDLDKVRGALNKILGEGVQQGGAQ